MSVAAESVTHIDLDSALKSKQLALVFEPCVSLRRLQARGAEAQLRWHHPQFGTLLPNLFMPFVLQEGRGREVTGFLLRELTRVVADWRRAGFDWTASVNIALEDLSDGTLPTTLGLLLSEFDLPPEALIIDVSESDIIDRGAQALPALAHIRTLGCGIALDSAPGEAMLQDLRGLPFTEIKIAGSAIIQFIERTAHSGAGRVAQRIEHAKSIGIPVTAVGVDDEAMLWATQHLDLDSAQGAYICEPLPNHALPRWDKIWRQAADSLRLQKSASVAAEPAPAVEAPAPVAHEPEPAAVDDAVPEAPVTEAYETEAVPPVAEEALFESEALDEIEALLATTAAAPVALDDEPVRDAAQSFEAEPTPTAEDAVGDVAISMEPPPIVEPLATEEPPPLVTPVDEPEVAPQASLPRIPRILADKTVVQPEPEAGPEDTASPKLIERRLPGIDKPIVMTVQNQGAERLGFLKRFTTRKAG